jgi:magnesium transporter
MLTNPKRPSPPSEVSASHRAEPRPAEVLTSHSADAAASSRGNGAGRDPELVAGAVRLAILGPEGIRETSDLGELAGALRSGRTVWIDAVSPSPSVVAEIGRILGLHPLIAEDIMEGNQRPKVEVTDPVVHVVMFAIRYADELVTSEVDFVLGDRFLLSVHEPRWNPRRVHQLRGGLAGVIGRGPDHLLWALVDAIVDGYFPVMDRFGDQIDELQDEVIERTSRDALQRLFQFKRDLLAMRRAVSPVREIFNQLTNRELALIDADEIIYFRDVYDHLIRITDELDTHRELVSGTLEVYLSTVNNNLSQIMKRLTGVTAVLAGAGALAGIFGMSEAATAASGDVAGGFWIITALIALMTVVGATVLRRIGWI